MAESYCLLFDAHGRVHSHHGTPIYHPHPPGPVRLWAQRQGGEPIPVTTQAHFNKVYQYSDVSTDTAFERLDDPQVVFALAVLEFQESTHFDTHTGEPVTFVAPTLGRTPSGREVYPRINPAVIGLVELAGKDCILLGRNHARKEYFSLIAGYVELGESFEEAFRREVMEETGRRIENIQYLRSQPWPYSQSIMAGFRATTTDEFPVTTPDNELVEVRWATREELASGAIPLPQSGSLALSLINSWLHE